MGSQSLPESNFPVLVNSQEAANAGFWPPNYAPALSATGMPYSVPPEAPA